MDIDQRNLWTEFFTSYNRALGDSFDSELAGIDDPEIMDAPGFDEAVRAQVQRQMHGWYERPLSDGTSATPQEMITRIATLDEAMEVFLLAAAHCDEELPNPLRHKLEAFGPAAVDRLLPLLFAPSWQEAEEEEAARPDDVLAASAALRLLGDWHAGEPFELILTRFLATSQPDEMIGEAFVAYCNGVGPAVIDGLTDALFTAAGSGHPLSGAYEYAVIALAEVGRKQPSDRVFLCLRECFRKMERKIIGAICLGDYGDGRAIPTLRGYVERFLAQIDRQLFYEILSAIKRLGGDISDLRDPFGGARAGDGRPRQ